MAGFVPLYDPNFEKDEEDGRFIEENRESGGDYFDLIYFSCEMNSKIGLRPHPAMDYDSMYQEIDYRNIDRLPICMNTIDVLDGTKQQPYSSYDKKYILDTYSEEEINQARIARNKYKKWLDEIDVIMEYPKIKILNSILSGEVTAYCLNEVAQIFDGEADKDDPYDDEPMLINSNHPNRFIEAPREALRATSIDWQKSLSRVGNLVFDMICVNSIELMQALPFPSDNTEIVVRKIGDVFVLDNFEETSPVPNQRRGRKPLPWPQMHWELGQMIERGEVPEKKEALIAQLMHWCEKNWDRRVSRAAIQLQLQGLDTAKK